MENYLKNGENILNHTTYLGTTQGKVIHSTKDPCQEALLIAPNDRWYLRHLPRSSEYYLCNECFPDNKESLYTRSFE